VSLYQGEDDFVVRSWRDRVIGMYLVLRLLII